MKGIPTPSIQKTVFQARYKPDLKFFDLCRPAAKGFSEYPHWSTDTTSVTLRDFENRCSLGIRANQFTFHQDSDNPKVEEERINHALTALPSGLQVRVFNRLGYRRQYLISTEISFESLVSILHIKLLSQDERLVRLLPPRVEDLYYRVDSADDEHRFHLSVGPLRRLEVPRWVTFDAENHLAPEDRDEEYRRVLAGHPETSVLIDIDVYRQADDIPVSDATSFVPAAREKAAKLALELTEYLFAKEVKG